MPDAELTLGQWLDSTWTGRAVKLVTILLPIGGVIIGWMVFDSRNKAEAAQRAATEMSDTMADIKSSVDSLRISVLGVSTDLSSVKASAARTAGIVEQMQLQMRPAVPAAYQESASTLAVAR